MNELTAKTRWRIVLLSTFAVAASLLHGCSNTSDNTPQPNPPPFNVLVSPNTLNTWVTSGYGTDAFGYSKAVVLDVASATGYATGHVPGALKMDTATDLTVSRSDGIGGAYSYTDTNSVTYTDINAPAEVATAAMMNALIQRTGVDAGTVVVLTGDSLLNTGMAYFDFRYWGFPKERLRVLDRSNAAYVTAGFTLDTATPASPDPSTYSVCDLTQNTSLRASLADMIHVAEGSVPNAISWDVRNQNEFDGVAGATPGPFSGKLGYTKKVAFEGHIKGAVNLVYTDLLGGSGTTILDPDTAKSALSAKGITTDVTTHVYCRSGARASVGFLILEGMLGYPAKLYDASWIEWGQMATSTKSGALSDDSPWRTDNLQRSAVVTYSTDSGVAVDQIAGADSHSLHADMVNVTDAAVCGG